MSTRADELFQGMLSIVEGLGETIKDHLTALDEQMKAYQQAVQDGMNQEEKPKE